LNRNRKTKQVHCHKQVLIRLAGCKLVLLQQAPSKPVRRQVLSKQAGCKRVLEPRKLAVQN
jgi:hypothetical protein